MKNWKIIAILTIALAAIALIVCTAMGVCTGMIETAKGTTVPMKCHWTVRVCEMLSVLAALIGAGQLFLKTKEARIFSAVCAAAIALCIILTASNLVIGVCAAEGMACGKTALWLRLMAGTSVLAELVGIILEARSGCQSKMF